MNELERSRATDWILEHMEVCPESVTTLIPMETGIGCAWTVRCACGEEKNITDYDSW